MMLLIAAPVVFLVLLLLDAWILAWAARLLKSSRGKFLLGLLAATLIGALGIAGLLLQAEVAAEPPALLGIAALSTVLQLGIVYFILKRVFVLSWGRAFGMFGVHILLCLVQLLLAFGLIRPFLAEAFLIPTASMSPTLVPRDCILANKLEHPRRWDLVLYRPPLPDGTLDSAIYCKRLVGLPGERLRFEGGNLYVNDRLMAAPAVVAGRYTVNLPSSRYHDGQTITLAADELFLIGDNAQKSYDSRSCGPSKQSSAVGVADLIYWPPGRFEVLR